MDLASIIRSRRSIRAFQKAPVPEALLRELVDLANWAPSAGNLQARDFIVVRDEKTKDALAQAADQTELALAAAVLVICTNAKRIAKYGPRGRELFSVQDAAAATQTFLLAAHERGLGAVWMGSFNEDEVRQVLHLPRYARPVTLVALGWPAENPAPPERLALDEVLHWEHW
ncbi:MAG TPA: nitroreductase family protein [Thermoplasmata archaeon]|nr:nitroreductase family protein [Thermoplasmata archaeon]